MKFNRLIFFLIVLVCAILVAYIIPQANNNLLLGAILGLLVGFVAFFKIEVGIYILVFSMLLSPELKLAQVPGRDVVMRIDDFFLVIVFLAWFARVAIDKGVGVLKSTPLNASVITYVVVCILFTLKGVINEDVKIASGFFYVLKYVEYFLLYFMVSNVVKDEKEVKHYLFAALVTLAVVVIYGYSQLGTGVRITAPFEDPIGTVATAGEPASIGGYLVICLAILIGIILNYKSILIRLLAITAFILIMPPFSQTLSRASYIAFGVMLVTVFFLTKKNRWIYGAVLASAVIIVPLIIPSNITARVFETFQGRQVVTAVGKVNLDESSMARIESWNRVLTVKLPKHLLTGFGVTGAGFIDGQYFTVLGEVGLIGFGVFLWMLVSIYRMGYKTYKIGTTDFTRAVSFGFTASFVALLSHAITANTFIIVRVMEPFWFLAALVAVLYRESYEKTSGKLA